jgi:cysteine synthase
MNWGALVGGSPLVRLRQSGDGRVLLKLEGRQASGSYWDRVVAAQFARLAAGDAVGFSGRHGHSVAVAAYARATGRTAYMLTESGDEARLEALVSSYGVAVVAELPEGAVLLARDDAEAHRRAFAGWLAELPPEAGVLVLPAYAGLVSAVEALAPERSVVWVEDDGERRRTLSEDAACRRTQVAHREGLLLSPLGAELVDAGVTAAVHGASQVIVLVPEGGQRHLGWW